MDLIQLFTAVGRGDVAATKVALANGANPNTTHPIGGQTLLYNACFADNLPMIELLLEHGADPNQRIEYHSPVDGRIEKDIVVLMMARFSNAARALISAGADVNAADVNGVTPLMRASRNGNADVVRELLASGACRDARDSSGRSARDYALGKLDFYKKQLKSASEKDIERICGPVLEVCQILDS